MNRITLFLGMLLIPWIAPAMSRVDGDCMQGGRNITTNGIKAAQFAMQSYVNTSGGVPSSGCTVTVDSGTTSLYSDNGITPLANPFTADAHGHWFFYTGNTTTNLHTVTMSGAGIPSAFSIDVVVFDIGSYQPHDVFAYPTGGVPGIVGIYNSTTSFYAGFTAAPGLSQNLAWQLPSSDANGCFLSNGSQVLTVSTTCLPASPSTSIQWNNNGVPGGSTSLEWLNVQQTLAIIGISNTPALTVSNGLIQTGANAYNAITSNTDGAVLRGLQVSQNAGITQGGYLVLSPVTYNPYDSGSQCFDQWGNRVTQPLPITGGTFGMYDSVLWVSGSPSMPSNGSCGLPLPVNPDDPDFVNRSIGLNTNSYFLARGGLATDNVASNSIQTLLGGIYARLGIAVDQALYLEQHSSTASLNTPSSLCTYPDAHTNGCYGSLAYQGGSIFWYWNNASLSWQTVDFSGGGGGGGTGCVPGGPTLAVQVNNGSGGCAGGAAAEIDTATGNFTLGGGTSGSSQSQLQITGTGANAGLNITATTAKSASIQSVGGITLTLATADTRAISITQAAAPSVNAIQLVNSVAATIWSVGSLGTTTAPGYVGTNTSTNNTFQNVGGSPNWFVQGNGNMQAVSLTLSAAIGGGVQCMETNNAGAVVLTGSPCGSGGGGGSPGGPSGAIQFNNGTFGGSANFAYTTPAAISTVTLTGQGINTANSSTTVPLTVNGFSGQTADLQDWYSTSGGTKLADIGSQGTFFGPGAALTITNSAFQGLIVKGASGQSANLAEFQNNTATVLANVGSLGTWFGPGAAFTITNSATVGVAIKGAPGQAANLLNFQDSSSNVLADIGSQGTFFGPGAALTITNSATQGLIVKAAVGQTADLVNYQNSSATTLFGFNNSGDMILHTVTAGYGTYGGYTRGGNSYEGYNSSGNIVILGDAGNRAGLSGAGQWLATASNGLTTTGFASIDGVNGISSNLKLTLTNAGFATSFQSYAGATASVLYLLPPRSPAASNCVLSATPGSPSLLNWITLAGASC